FPALLGEVHSQELQLAAIAVEANLDNALVVAPGSKDREGKAEPTAQTQAPGPVTAVPQPQGGYGLNFPPNFQMPPGQQGQQNPGMQAPNPLRREPAYGYGSRANTRIQATNEGKLSTYADNAYNVYQNTVN